MLYYKVEVEHFNAETHLQIHISKVVKLSLNIDFIYL